MFMNLTLFTLAFITFLSTMAGGLVAVRLRGILHYFFAFSSGALIAISFFDLLPESVANAESVNLSIRSLMIALVATFLVFYILERFFLTHHHHEDEEHGHIMGPIGATGLIIHSFLDGAAIGIAFQVDSSVGVIIALAVISHDFTDGINTVVIMLKNQQKVRNASIFLVMDAIAPVFGILATSVFTIDQSVLSLMLAAFCGQFLYMGTASLLPEIHEHDALKTVMTMVFAIVLILVLTSIV